MVIDGHRHLTGPVDDLLRDMDRHGIDRSVLVGIGVRDLNLVRVDWSPVFRSYLTAWLLGTVKGRWVARRLRRTGQLLDKPANDPVLAAIAQHPDRLSGFAFIDPASPDALVEATRCLDGGMQGLKFALLQYPAALDGEAMHALCGLASARRVPVFFHVGISSASYRFERLVRTYPTVPFILAHAGAQRFWRGLLFGRAIPNLFYDLSSHYVTRAKMRVLVRAVGPRRMLFGSDVPVMADSPDECLGRIDALGLAAADTSAIKGGTVATLLRGICH